MISKKRLLLNDEEIGGEGGEVIVMTEPSGLNPEEVITTTTYNENARKKHQLPISVNSGVSPNVSIPKCCPSASCAPISKKSSATTTEPYGVNYDSG